MTTNRFQDVYSAILARGAPPLGFGCANLFDGWDGPRSRRLLAAALDQGLKYFDTARLYAFGQSERLVGEAVRGRRDQVVIASKAGILPAPDTRLIRAYDRLLQAAHLKPPKREPRFGIFGPRQVRKSLETSLKELGTDYIDIVLLHECELENAHNAELIDVLEQMVGQGKIRSWGSASLPGQTVAIAGNPPPPLSVLQAAHSVFDPLLPEVRRRTGLPFIVHSVLSRKFSAFVEALSSNPFLAARARSLGVDPSDTSALGARLIASALQESPGGPVLFATLREERIAQAIGAPLLTAAEVEPVTRLAREWARSQEEAPGPAAIRSQDQPKGDPAPSLS